MATFDEIQMTTLLALTDPRSPYFLKALAELRTLDMQKEYDIKVIDRVVLALLNDKSLEDNLLVQQQLERARETHSKYLEDYAAYQQAVYKQSLDDLNLAPKQMSEYLSTQNSKLEKELEVWDAKLKSLPEDQAKISEQWSKMQEKAGKEFAEKIEGTLITSLDGKSREISSDEIAQLKNKLFNTSNDPNKLIKYIPSLVDPNPANVEANAAKLERKNMAMNELNASIGIKDLFSDIKESDNANLKPSELIRLRKLNSKVVDAATTVRKEQSSDACGLQAKALTTNEVYIKKQKDLIVNQMEENSKKAEKVMENKETKSSLPTPKPK